MGRLPSTRRPARWDAAAARRSTGQQQSSCIHCMMLPQLMRRCLQGGPRLLPPLPLPLPLLLVVVPLLALLQCWRPRATGSAATATAAQGHTEVAELLLRHAGGAASLEDKKGRRPVDCTAAGSAVRQLLEGCR